MSLTKDNLVTLKSHFEAHEHEFLNGNAYISEEAITERIEQVDPNWTLEILNKTVRQTFGNDVSIIITVRLTICGTSRDGVGMNKVTPKTGEWKPNNQWANKDKANKKTDWIEYDKADYTEVNEAEKSAATDALKRAARLFGIGRYLLALPKNVKDSGSMARWLNSASAYQPAATSPRNAAAPASGSSHETTERASNGHSSDFIENGTKDTVILKALNVMEKDGKRRLKFTTTDGRTALAFTRQLFQERGWCDTEEWIELGDHKLDANIPAGITYHLLTDDNGEIKGGYWEISSVSEVVFDDTKAAV